MFVSQHICMSRPQSSGGIVQEGGLVERSQIMPASHPRRGPQGSPMPPVSVERMHMPPGEQIRSPVQSVPPGRPIGPQHGWSISPHAYLGSVTSTQFVPSHESVRRLHALAPSQQRSPVSPHASHVPALQTLPERQVKPAQQVPPGPPQSPESPGPPGPGPSMSSVSGLRHTPLAHTMPVQQSLAPLQLPPRGAQHAPP
jgi:hypothetical protein